MDSDQFGFGGGRKLAHESIGLPPVSFAQRRPQARLADCCGNFICRPVDQGDVPPIGVQRPSNERVSALLKLNRKLSPVEDAGSIVREHHSALNSRNRLKQPEREVESDAPESLTRSGFERSIASTGGPMNGTAVCLQGLSGVLDFIPSPRRDLYAQSRTTLLHRVANKEPHGEMPKVTELLPMNLAFRCLRVAIMVSVIVRGLVLIGGSSGTSGDRRVIAPAFPLS